MSGFEYLNRGLELSLKPVSAVEAFALVVVVQVSVDETQRSAFASSLRPTRCFLLMLLDGTWVLNEQAGQVNVGNGLSIRSFMVFVNGETQ
jgi:hypothetical protein